MPSERDLIAYEKVKSAVRLIRSCKDKQEADEKLKGSELEDIAKQFGDYIRLPDKQ